MNTPRHSRLRRALLVPLLAAGLAAPTVPAVAAPVPVPGTAVAVGATAPAASAIRPICESRLPSQAHDTIELIEKGGPFPYPKDGTVFQNREGVLPQKPRGHYHEYTVKTPGSSTRGARRIVTAGYKGDDGMYYTADHYRSFSLVDFTC
ncbi:ribonuclease domain-containing protein [Actinomadura kijaniata]|uniref:ribonuclease domain-containing protein n=1 Tax=Actinomadura kijaniata TaxID=46161 RepID=UPI003F1A3D7E